MVDIDNHERRKQVINEAAKIWAAWQTGKLDTPRHDPAQCAHMLGQHLGRLLTVARQAEADAEAEARISQAGVRLATQVLEALRVARHRAD